MALIPDNQVTQAREVPVNDAAARLGLIPKREGVSVKWTDSRETPQFVINVTGMKFYDHLSSRGGAGSISLVQHVRNCSFREAVAFLMSLQQQACDEQCTHSLFPKALPSEPPQPSYEEALAKYGQRDESVWPVACEYLVQKRRLPLSLIESLHTEGKIFSTDHQHVDKDSQPTFKRPAVAFVGSSLDGAHQSILLRDTKHISSWRMFVGKKTLAPFTLGNLETCEEIVAVESPIDALSYHCLHNQNNKAFIASVGGMVVSQLLIDLAKTTGKPLVCALDNDFPGYRGWRDLQLKMLFYFSHELKQPVVFKSESDDTMKLVFALGSENTMGVTEDEVQKIVHEADRRRIPTEVILDGIPCGIFRRIPRLKDWSLDLAFPDKTTMEEL